MIGIGAFDATAGALQLVVPSYGLRLVRRFGTRRVGWFLVAAFVSLGALHLLAPMDSTSVGLAPDMKLNMVYMIGCVLLLIGMGHIDTFFSQYDRSRSSEQRLSDHWEEQARRKTAHLEQANEALQAEIARRQHAEAILRESEAQYRFLFTENPQPMWVFDLEQNRFLAVNKAALRQYGFTAEEFMRLTPPDLLPPERVAEFTQEFSQSFSRAESRTFWQHFRKDQTLFDVELVCRDLDYAGMNARLAVINDLTQFRQREGSAHYAKKMDLMSRVAGAAGHRFNDILSAIESHTALLRQTTREPAVSEQLQELSVIATRGTNLGSQMLAISGRQLIQPRPLDVNRLIANMSLILRRVINEKVMFQCLCGRNPLPVMADPKVIENVLMTLVKNARDAMPDKGRLTISTSVVRVENPPIKRNPESGTEEFVRISVRDTGCGMTAEMQSHLFEAFFTTKAPDKGQGLGLACAYGAIRQHWGWIECTTSLNMGAEFQIFLPCVSDALLPSASEMQAATNVDRGTVLLVDPDDRARGVARYVLNRNGYRVVEADSSSIAMLLWEGQGRTIDLLLTDLVLPGGSGFDLAGQLLQMRPDLKVIYACSNETEHQRAALPAQLKSVTKPYRSDQLIQAVESLMPPQE